MAVEKNLAFVASDGVAQLKQEFLSHEALFGRILDDHYRDEQGYYFPFQHFFMTIRKQSTSVQE